MLYLLQLDRQTGFGVYIRVQLLQRIVGLNGAYSLGQLGKSAVMRRS